MGRVIDALSRDDKHVRKVKLRTSTGILEHPIHKLVLLLEKDQGIPVKEPQDDDTVNHNMEKLFVVFVTEVYDKTAGNAR